MNREEEMAANIETGERQSADGAAGSDEKSDHQLHTILENIGRVAHQDDPRSEFTRPLDLEAFERKSIYDRKKRSSRGFTRYLFAICIGVAATLACQSYGEAAKQLFAANAPELGWSPETKQMIANWVEQLGWTKPPQAASVRKLHQRRSRRACPSSRPSTRRRCIKWRWT